MTSFRPEGLSTSVDTNDMMYGSLQLDPGESVNVVALPSATFDVTVLAGTVRITMGRQTITLTEGQNEEISPFNQPPVANAGPDQVVEATSTSGAIDQGILLFSWRGYGFRGVGRAVQFRGVRAGRALFLQRSGGDQPLKRPGMRGGDVRLRRRANSLRVACSQCGQTNSQGGRP